MHKSKKNKIWSPLKLILETNMKKGWLSCACMCAIRVYTCVFLICAKVVTGLGHQASRPQGPFCAGIINAGHHTSFLTGSWRSNSAPHAAWQALCWRSHLPRPFLIFFFFYFLKSNMIKSSCSGLERIRNSFWQATWHKWSFDFSELPFRYDDATD